MKNLLKKKHEDDSIVDDIILSLHNEYSLWKFTEYEAIFGGLKIWIENSPYADCRMDGRILPRREELRKAFYECRMRQARDNFNKL